MLQNNVRLSRAVLAALAIATVLSSGGVISQTASAAQNPGVTAPSPASSQHEASQPTPLVTETGARVVADPAPITRQEIMARAKRWVDLRIPYSNDFAFEGYRQDCSGFVSMAWTVGSSKTTRYLYEISHPITKDELLPGDALNWVNPNPNVYGHVRIFGGWLDTGKTRYWVYEQTPDWARYDEYSWAATQAKYKPIRYNHVIETPPQQPVDPNPPGPAYHQVRKTDGSWTGFAPIGIDSRDVAMATLPDGTAQVVAVGKDDVVYHRVRNADGSWTAFAPLWGFGTHAKAQKVSIAGGHDGSTQVVISTVDGTVYHNMRKKDGSWTNFAPLDVGAKDVAITVMPDLSAQVVIAGVDDVVQHRVRKADGSWTPFVPLWGFGQNAEATKVSIAGDKDGNSQVLIATANGVVYHNFRKADGTWTNFAPLDASAKDVAITAMPDGSTQVVIADLDDVVQHRVRKADGSWTPFAPLWGFGQNAKAKKVTIAGGHDSTAHVLVTGI
jgi:hypothetical protein